MSLLQILIHQALANHSEVGLFDIVDDLQDCGFDGDIDQVVRALDALDWLRDGTLRHEHDGIVGVQPRYVRRHVA
jgi:hypothetical protein